MRELKVVREDAHTLVRVSSPCGDADAKSSLQILLVCYAALHAVQIRGTNEVDQAHVRAHAEMTFLCVTVRVVADRSVYLRHEPKGT